MDEHHLEKEYHFKDFRKALVFTKRVGELGEDQGLACPVDEIPDQAPVGYPFRR
jgi:hypothetical protein